MIKFGEIARINYNDYRYILKAHRYTYKQLDIPWIDIFISSKSSKKIRGNKLSKSDRMYSLVNDTGFFVIRKIINAIKDYLKNINPEYLAISAYNDNFNKRISFYEKQLNRLGWFVVDSEILNRGTRDEQRVLYFAGNKEAPE